MSDLVNAAIRRLKELSEQLDRGTIGLDEAAEPIRKGLAYSSSRVARRAAEVVSDHCVASLIPEMQAAYERFLTSPIKSDPGCEAKLAIVKAFRRVDFTDVDFYLAALEYEQHEPIWGGTTDTAGEIRANAALVLVRLGIPDIGLRLVDLMCDGEPSARVGAIRALAGSGRVEAEPLLRLKLRMGDTRAEVMGECFAGLLAINADNSFRLVAKQLESEEREVRNEAAIALGESRHPSALGKLQAAFRGFDDPEDHRAMAIAMGLMRSQEAVDFLVEQIAVGDSRDSIDSERAVAAIIALSHCRDMDEVDDRVRAAVNGCDDRYVARVFNETFGM